MTNKKIKLQTSKTVLTEHKLDDGTVVKLNPVVTRIILADSKSKVN
ncbi:hypothetical protein [Brachyspira pulli]|nr:hypothetical protein [uncultured Brachyspira sp.]